MSKDKIILFDALMELNEMSSDSNSKKLKFFLLSNKEKMPMAQLLVN